MWHWWYFNFPGKVQFGVKEKRFGIRVFCVHGGSNREEITRFAVKRLNVPLLATVTVMPHTTTSFPLALHSHSHMTRWWYLIIIIWWHINLMISHPVYFLKTSLYRLAIFTIFVWSMFPSWILSQEGSSADCAKHCWSLDSLSPPSPY